LFQWSTRFNESLSNFFSYSSFYCCYHCFLVKTSICICLRRRSTSNGFLRFYIDFFWIFFNYYTKFSLFLAFYHLENISFPPPLLSDLGLVFPWYMHIHLVYPVLFLRIVEYLVWYRPLWILRAFLKTEDGNAL
jgi:hypothetical protein